EVLLRSHADLLERLEAVGDEGGAEDGEALHTPLGELGQHVVGIGPHPLLSAEARLEGHGPRALLEPEAPSEAPRGGVALRAVAVAVLVDDGVTAARA